MRSHTHLGPLWLQEVPLAGTLLFVQLQIFPALYIHSCTDRREPIQNREAKSCSTNHDVLHQAGIWRGAKRYLGNMAWTQQDSEEIQEGVETTEGRERAWKLESEVLALRPNFFFQLWNPGHITQLSELSPSHTHLSELAHWVG